MISLQNLLTATSLRRASGGKGHLAAWAGVFALLILAPIASGVCPCTMFTAACVVMVVAAALGVGNSAFGALTSEREKKTLDSLRLTQLSAHEVLLGKLLPEFTTLGKILLVTAPTVLLAAVLGDDGLGTALAAIMLAALGGSFAAVMGIFFSSLLPTTSQAVVAGWITKGVWLLATPLLDSVSGAVLVQNVSPPTFTSINPLAALGVLLVPEGAAGARAMLPLVFPFATIAAIAFMWWYAARRFANGMAAGAGLRDREVHVVYRQGYGPAWLGRAFPMLREIFLLRELAAQVRSGAGRWPGYMVFLVLFLAPTFYARSWALNELTFSQMEAQQAQHVQVIDPSETGLPDQASTSNKSVHMRTVYGTEVVLDHHTSTACLRMALFQMWGVPLPKDQLRFYQRRLTSSTSSVTSMVAVKEPDVATANALNLNHSRSYRQSLNDDSRDSVTLSSLHVGIAGAIALLLLYLGVRFSAFLATAVTGERSRRTWEDLALTGVTAREALTGKVVGAVLLPIKQMTVTFPAMLLFVFTGHMSVLEIGALYLYALALSLAAAMLGLWTSASATSSHEAHLRALVWVVVAFFALPLGLSTLYGPLACMAAACALLAFMQRNGDRWNRLAWLCLALVLALAPQSLSPLTAAVSFMPSLTASHSFLSLLGVAPSNGAEALLNLLCGIAALLSVSTLLWNSALRQLADPAEAIRAEAPVRNAWGTI